MTLSKIKGPKTHFSKLRDQNMIFSKVKGPKTYFSLTIIFVSVWGPHYLNYFSGGVLYFFINLNNVGPRHAEK